MRHDLPLTGPDALGGSAAYRLLTSAVVPRPIAWVSSRSAAGVDNLAPHSFFTVVSSRPPMVQFTSVGRKDSVTNIEETGEFVVNVTPEPLFEQVNATGTDYPRDVSEFDAVGLTREPSVTVAVPRVAESPVALECRLHEVRPTGNCLVVVGEVLHAAVDESLLDLTGGVPYVDVRRLNPLSRLGRDEWGLLGEIREIARVPYSRLGPR